jgi:hypothetical protein
MDGWDWLDSGGDSSSDVWGDGFDLTDNGGDYGSNLGDYNLDNSGGGIGDTWDTSGMGNTEAPGWNDMSTGGGSVGSGDFMGSWGKLLGGAALQGAGGLLDFYGQGKLSDKDTSNKIKLMQATLAEQEKYYQLHGKHLEDAYGKYKGFYKPQGPAQGAMTGLLANAGGPSGYFH